MADPIRTEPLPKGKVINMYSPDGSTNAKFIQLVWCKSDIRSYLSALDDNGDIWSQAYDIDDGFYWVKAKMERREF